MEAIKLFAVRRYSTSIADRAKGTDGCEDDPKHANCNDKEEENSSRPLVSGEEEGAHNEKKSRHSYRAPIRCQPFNPFNVPDQKRRRENADSQTTDEQRDDLWPGRDAMKHGSNENKMSDDGRESASRAEKGK